MITRISKKKCSKKGTQFFARNVYSIKNEKKECEQHIHKKQQVRKGISMAQNGMERMKNRGGERRMRLGT